MDHPCEGALKPGLFPSGGRTNCLEGSMLRAWCLEVNRSAHCRAVPHAAKPVCWARGLWRFPCLCIPTQHAKRLSPISQCPVGSRPNSLPGCDPLTPTVPVCVAQRTVQTLIVVPAPPAAATRSRVGSSVAQVHQKVKCACASARNPTARSIHKVLHIKNI